MNFYSIILAIFRLIAVCVGCYYAYILISALIAPAAPEFMNRAQEEMLRYHYDQAIRQSLINIGAAITLYFLAPLLGRLITSGGDRRR